MDSDQPLPDEIGVNAEEVVFEESNEDCSYSYEYDSTFCLSQERNLLYDLYQPEETANGTFLCKICLRTGREMEFHDRLSFSAHRYKCHGSFNNNIICPILNCREVFASMSALRKHLILHHNLPLEVHHQTFANISDFERYRHMIESSTGCRFMMHTKQPKLRRQVMHCSKSEHKLVMQTSKHKLPRVRMEKEGACCPANISFRIDGKTGEVSSFCQLYHVGHAPSNEDNETATDHNWKPFEVHFPQKPKFYGERSMQYLQIDIYEMPTSVYGPTLYENILFIMDLKSRFKWARPLAESNRFVTVRHLTSIFLEYGVPEGFATSFSSTIVRDAIKSIEHVFGCEIREVWSQPPEYEKIEMMALDKAQEELGSTNRWAEAVPFVMMELNQMEDAAEMTSFQRMFQRKPPKLFSNEKLRAYEEDDGCEHDDPRHVEFQAGDKVFLRRLLKKPGRGAGMPFVYGLVTMVDNSKPYFPYKVHYSKSENPWPSEMNAFRWCSPFDLLPTTHKLLSFNENDRRKHYEKLFCTCTGESRQKYDIELMGAGDKCPLIRNVMCSNRMSRVCCKLEGQLECGYHALYPVHDDSYAKLETAMANFTKYQKQPFEVEVENGADDEKATTAQVVEIEMVEKDNDGEKEKKGEELEEQLVEAPHRKRKRTQAPSPTPSVESTSSQSRRQSNRKVVRPKTFDDYV